MVYVTPDPGRVVVCAADGVPMNAGRHRMVLTDAASFVHRRRAFVVAIAGLMVVAVAGTAAAGGARTIRISVSSTEGQASESLSEPFSVSGDGRYVAFDSDASEPGGRRHQRDSATCSSGTVRSGHDQPGERVQRRRPGQRLELRAGDERGRPVRRLLLVRVEPGARRHRTASSMCSSATGGRGTTSRVSVSSTGAQGNETQFRRRRSARTAGSSPSSRSRPNLVPGDTNGIGDVFVRDRRSGTTEPGQRVDRRRAGATATSFEPAISADGRFVAFTSYASNLVPGDTNGAGDVFVRDRRTGTTSRVSVSSRRRAGQRQQLDWPAISADGRFVAFTSDASNLVPGDTNDVARRVRPRPADRHDEPGQRVGTGGARATAPATTPAISADGRFVAFTSFASNLVPGDTNGPRRLRPGPADGTTTRVSVSTGGAQSNGYSYGPAINADGRFVAFSSNASNLVPGDTNSVGDAFLRHHFRLSRQGHSSFGQRGLSSGHEHSAFGRTEAINRWASAGRRPSRRAPPTRRRRP